ncbi:monooxygenase [Solihabitans fulvus]|uniref:Monooxygenase n=1 Tax=Solihabitans fulvus TaxID=1892852 RepID=A0A5B2X4Q5_9PSEU|nr:monooxygenase [Solihabitans fulvus]KAA2258062.1 monooxygenase [Solihabitans fulvus]
MPVPARPDDRAADSTDSTAERPTRDAAARPVAPSGARDLGHAVVIGAGVAGLLAARVLADRFGRVTLVERDLTNGDDGNGDDGNGDDGNGDGTNGDGTHRERAQRGGIPQALHPHGMLARGREIIEELVPGLWAELLDAGAPVFDFGEGVRMLFPSGLPDRLTSGVPNQTFTRHLLDARLNARVRALPGVTVLDGRHATGLVHDPGANRVTGLTLRSRRNGVARQDDVTLHADLVVDASGRSSHLADWLVRLGLPRPAETTVDARLGYATRVYRVPEDPPFDWFAMVESVAAPGLPHGCFALRTEGDQLVFTLQGAGGAYPPGDEAGFLAFADTLRSGFADALRQLTSISPIHCFRHTVNRRVAYHRVPRWPDGLIVVGDAVCTFNPIYGQGMTVACLEAVLLRDMLAAWGRTDLTGLAGRYLRRQAKVTFRPWLLATAVDRGWQEGAKPARLTAFTQWFMDSWFGSLPGDPVMYQHFIKVMNMLTGPETLLRPRMLSRILATAVRNRSRRTPTYARAALHTIVPPSQRAAPDGDPTRYADPTRHADPTA